MKLIATDQGLLIPKELLGENQEFEIMQEQEKLIIIRVGKSTSIWDLGSNPAECDVTDGALNHDCYIYNQ
jgi:virulence-associated protein VagC